MSTWSCAFWRTVNPRPRDSVSESEFRAVRAAGEDEAPGAVDSRDEERRDEGTRVTDACTTPVFEAPVAFFVAAFLRVVGGIAQILCLYVFSCISKENVSVTAAIFKICHAWYIS